MSSTQDSSEALSLLPPAPFKTIAEIQEMPHALLAKRPFANVIGFVKDYMAPIPTRGSDYKCTIEIMDLSIKYESSGLRLNIFRPLNDMPAATGPSDVILLRNVAVQVFQNSVSLLSNRSSEIHSMQASQIPASISPFQDVKWRSTPPLKCKLPTRAETIYVISANSRVNEIALPSNEAFQEKSMQAMNVKEKFSLLKDVEVNCFYDILGEVIKVFDSQTGALTVYLTDYTENAQFFHHAWGETGQPADARDGDEYGYTKSRTKKVDEWPGPFGKLSIQLTMFDENAKFVREEVKVGQWILLSNVRMKYGKTGKILEGALHSEDDRVKVQVMELGGESGAVDSRLKEAVRRKWDEKKSFDQQKKDILEEEAGLGDKRKRGNEVPSKNNSKKRRKERRAAGERKAAELDTKVAKSLNLNESIQCTHQDQPITAVAEILQPLKVVIGPNNDQKTVSPFTNSRYRAHVRVVDYHPHQIEDFAVGRRGSDFDVLSDYSGGEDTDPEEDMRHFRDGKGFAKHFWEWRFQLLVEDGNGQGSKERMWLVVDNQSAQMLLGLEEDAANLRADQDLLAKVKEQLFKLWGDLEEKKSQTLQTAKQSKSIPTPLIPGSSPPAPRRKAGDQPDLDSSSDAENDGKSKNPRLDLLEDLVSQERSSNIRTPSKSQTADAQIGENPNIDLSPNNKPFTCCIRQFGVKVREKDPSKANAGEGKRWQRMFGLFGTQIL